MASSPAPSLGVEPKPNITQLCFSICSMILLCGFINKSKHIKTATVTPTKFTHDQKRKRKENFKFTTQLFKVLFFCQLYHKNIYF